MAAPKAALKAARDALAAGQPQAALQHCQVGAAAPSGRRGPGPSALVPPLPGCARGRAPRRHAGGGAARADAQEVLAQDPSNYNALVFLGKAHGELGSAALSEQAYRQAAQAAPDQPLAWLVGPWRRAPRQGR